MARSTNGQTMNTDQLLGSDNRNRVKELGKESFSAEDILKNLASGDRSLRRDAALSILQLDHGNTFKSETTAIIDALAETLKPPAAWEGTDALAWATCAEAALAALHTLADAGLEGVSDDLLRSLIPFVDASQPWSTTAAASTAARLLDRYLAGAQKRQEFITRDLLQHYLRPIFSKSSASITAQGRPALYREPPPEGSFHAHKAAWKEAGPYVVTVFDWAVEASETTTIKQHWPLYVPVLVTLAEDNDVAVRQRGIDILNRFLAKCPREVLRTSGIDSVFEESVFPSLLFLPTLTPEDESVALLRSAYRTLRTLAVAADADPTDRNRRALLDKTLREGVLAGYLHASQHIRVVEVLMRVTAQVVEALQVYAVKHLQNLLDLFAPVLADAFALAYVPAVVAAAQALNSTILNCWPRIVGTPHAEHIINIVCRCWVNVHDSDDSRGSPDLEILGQELKKTMALMASLWRGVDQALPLEKFAKIVQITPTLKPLFAPFQPEKSMA